MILPKSSLILLFVLYICCTLPFPALPQQSNSEALAYNVGANAIFSGIGAIINKEKKENWRRAFLRGAWQGGVGGYLVFESKRQVYKFSNTGNYAYTWTSKLTNAIGNSIVQNGASSNPFGQEWYLNLGFNRLALDFKAERKLSYRIMPFSLLYGTLIPLKDYSFDTSTSLKTGQIVFKTDAIIAHPRASIDPEGTSPTNSMVLEHTAPKLIAHELIHIYQYEDFAKFLPYFDRPRENWLNHENKAVQLYLKIFYTDINATIFSTSYEMFMTDIDECYYNNPLEQEANFYSYRILCK